MHNVEQTQPMLEVCHLKKAFHLHLVDGRVIEPFADISFQVGKGELFMISGKSGIGKTTVLKCIYRTYLTTGGDIWYSSQHFERVNIATASEDVVMKLREHELAFCSQFLKVLPRVPAVDVTAEPLVQRGMERSEARKEAERWLRRFRYI